MEFPDFVDLVTEELDAHRMRVGGREHVENTAAHREFAAVHHQIDAGIRIAQQTLHSLVERQFLAFDEHQRLHIAKTGDNRLDERTHRHDQHADRPEHGIGGVGVLEPAEYRHTARNRVGPWAQTLVRQRLPRFEMGDVGRIACIPGAQGVDGFLGFTTGRDDDHDLAGMPVRRNGGSHSRPNARRGSDDKGCVDVVFGGFGSAVRHGCERGVVTQCVKQPRKARIHRIGRPAVRSRS